MRFAIDGLVLRESNTGENDKLLLVLTASKGKIWVKAKGGRSIKNSKSALCRAFTYGEFELYDKNGITFLSGGAPSNTFFAYQTDLEGYALATYISEICEEITGEDENSEAVLRATLNAFYAIEKKLFPLSQIKAAYEVFAACVSGFAPELSCCADCSHELAMDSSIVSLDVMNGGIVCKECLEKRGVGPELPDVDQYATKSIILPLDSSALMAMKYCSEAKVNRLFNFSITDQSSMNFFAKAAETYLLNHLERGFNTLNFYKSVKD